MKRPTTPLQQYHETLRIALDRSLPTGVHAQVNWESSSDRLAVILRAEYGSRFLISGTEIVKARTGQEAVALAEMQTKYAMLAWAAELENQAKELRRAAL